MLMIVTKNKSVGEACIASSAHGERNIPRVNTRQEDSYPRFDLRNKKPEISFKKTVPYIIYDTDTVSIII